MATGTCSFVLLGYGFIGKRHAEQVGQHAFAQLTGIIDPFVQEGPENVPLYPSLEEYLKNRGPADVAILAVPNALHIPLAMQCLEAGMHVVVEKPMGLDTASCLELIDLAVLKNKEVFVVKQNRYSPPSRWMKEIVSQGLLGNILEIQVNCFWNRDERYYGKSRSGSMVPETDNWAETMTNRKKAGLHPWKGSLALDGGILFTQFSHFVDILYWVFGEMEPIYAHFANHLHRESTGFEDSGTAILALGNGGRCTLHFSTALWDKNLESSMTVIGSRGSFKIGGQYMNEVSYCHIDNYELPELAPTNQPNNYGAFQGSAANHAQVIDNVIRTLQGLEIATANAKEGMKVVEIIEKIYRFRK